MKIPTKLLSTVFCGSIDTNRIIGLIERIKSIAMEGEKMGVEASASETILHPGRL